VRRSVAGVPVIVAGRILDLAMAEDIVASGQADMVGLTRALIADPHIVRKAAAGGHEAVNRCIGCNECHYGALRPTVCAVNAAAGHEEELELLPAEQPRRILIVGGGPAGMECARVAAVRGHTVRLVEARPELGGMLAIAGRDPNRSELAGYVSYLAGKLRELEVEVMLGCELSPTAIIEDGADVVVLATGAHEYEPEVPGVRDARVTSAARVLTGEATLGRRVAVVGGLEDHFPPLTVADLLAGRGHEVVLLSELLHVGEGIEPAGLYMLTKRLLLNNVDIQPMTALREVRADGALIVANSLTRARHTLEPVDSVVLACGGRPRDELAAELRGRVPRLHVIGDALSPRRLVHATLDGARMGSTV
jgi:NADPH-dependent 2,4-dienoyl-CoA reductase/sulfur reductase-like enzyme